MSKYLFFYYRGDLRIKIDYIFIIRIDVVFRYFELKLLFFIDKVFFILMCLYKKFILIFRFIFLVGKNFRNLFILENIF